MGLLTSGQICVAGRSGLLAHNGMVTRGMPVGYGEIVGWMLMVKHTELVTAGYNSMLGHTELVMAACSNPTGHIRIVSVVLQGLVKGWPTRSPLQSRQLRQALCRAPVRANFGLFLAR